MHDLFLGFTQQIAHLLTLLLCSQVCTQLQQKTLLVSLL